MLLASANAAATSPRFEQNAPAHVSRAAAPPGVHTYLVELEEPAASQAFVRSRARGESGAVAAEQAKNQKLRNKKAQERLLRAIPSAAKGARPLFQVQMALNGVAVRADAADAAALRGLPEVKSVRRIMPAERHKGNSVPFIRSPEVWTSLGVTGQNIKIGIIDSGIDYVHPDFGGSGLYADQETADLAENNPLTTNTTHVPGFSVGSSVGSLFPSAKVVGGWDFVGDAYTGSNTPQPDPNPDDCSSYKDGHGTHVAGIAAGFGVNADGTPYTGPWDDNAPFASLKIGPGVAPQALLYALRVFGCRGSTELVPAAIDWALDPNGDGDPSDRLDVINLSLGSSFGSPDGASGAAADNAAALGVVVVASAGNSGDLYYVSGSPGNATRVLSVASAMDSVDIVDGFRVETPSAVEGTYAASKSADFGWHGMTPVTAPLYYPAVNQDGCAAWSSGEAAKISGNILLVDWRLGSDTEFNCGSATRSNNAFDAGAKGIIMAENVPYFEVSIAGNRTVPAVYTTSTVGSTLKGALTPGVISSHNVTLSDEFSASTRFEFAGLADKLSSSSSRGPQQIYSGLKPDISAPGFGIFSARAGFGSDGVSMGGTSMAAPHMAGVMALLKQLNPDWTVEALKALAMNYAGHDLFNQMDQAGPAIGPARVGAGRVDVADAAAAKVVAFNTDNPGAVSVSFGALEVLGTSAWERTIRVANHGDATASFNLSIDPRTAIDGVTFSFPDGATVDVSANSVADFRLRLSADAALMKHTKDPTVADMQEGALRQYVSEASGLVLLTPAAGGPVLRVPYYAAARPASQMAASQTALQFAADTGSSTTLNLAGTGVNTGGSTPEDYLSIVSPFELSYTSLQETLQNGETEGVRGADLKYVGVTAVRTDNALVSRLNNSQIYFGIATHGQWSAPAGGVEFKIYIDKNQDGTPDFMLYNGRISGSDVMGTFLYNFATYADEWADDLNMYGASFPTAIFNNNVMVLSATVGTGAGQLDLGTNTRFNYQVSADYDSSPFDETPWLTFDYASPGLDFNAARAGEIDYDDLPGQSLPVAFNGPSYRANASQGALLLHHYNQGETRAQVLPVCGPITVTPPTVNIGNQGTAFSQTFTQSGGLGTATFSTTSALPAGLTLSSDGVLAGDPSQTGTFQITVTATDANGCIGAAHYTLTIAPPVSTNACGADTLFQDHGFSGTYYCNASVRIRTAGTVTAPATSQVVLSAPLVNLQPGFSASGYLHIGQGLANPFP